jgi:hypothetical protein
MRKIASLPFAFLIGSPPAFADACSVLRARSAERVNASTSSLKAVIDFIDEFGSETIVEDRNLWLKSRRLVERANYDSHEAIAAAEAWDAAGCVPAADNFKFKVLLQGMKDARRSAA